MPFTRVTSREIKNMAVKAEDLASDPASLKQVSGGKLELIGGVLADTTYNLDACPYTVELVRDTNGNVSQVLTKDGATIISTITLTYDASGKLTSVTETAGGRTVTTTLNYDASGNLTSVTRS